MKVTLDAVSTTESAPLIKNRRGGGGIVSSLFDIATSSLGSKKVFQARYNIIFDDTELAAIKSSGLETSLLYRKPPQSQLDFDCFPETKGYQEITILGFVKNPGVEGHCSFNTLPEAQMCLGEIKENLTQLKAYIQKVIDSSGKPSKESFEL